MSDERVIQHMIGYVQEKEKEMISLKMATGNNLKSNIVNSIISELERELENENK